jgi:hypothetical protein
MDEAPQVGERVDHDGRRGTVINPDDPQHVTIVWDNGETGTCAISELRKVKDAR